MNCHHCNVFVCWWLRCDVEGWGGCTYSRYLTLFWTIKSYFFLVIHFILTCECWGAVLGPLVAHFGVCQSGVRLLLRPNARDNNDLTENVSRIIHCQMRRDSTTSERRRWRWFRVASSREMRISGRDWVHLDSTSLIFLLNLIKFCLSQSDIKNYN